VPNPNTFITGPWTVDKVLDAIPTGRLAEGSTSPVAYFHILERLKTMKREGWRRFGIAQ
jgi:putative hydrolases of HD superfamily